MQTVKVTGCLGAVSEHQGHSMCRVKGGSQRREGNERQSQDVAVEAGSRTVTGLGAGGSGEEGTMKSTLIPSVVSTATMAGK